MYMIIRFKCFWVSRLIQITKHTRGVRYWWTFSIFPNKLENFTNSHSVFIFSPQKKNKNRKIQISRKHQKAVPIVLHSKVRCDKLNGGALLIACRARRNKKRPNACRRSRRCAALKRNSSGNVHGRKRPYAINCESIRWPATNRPIKISRFPTTSGQHPRYVTLNIFYRYSSSTSNHKSYWNIVIHSLFLMIYPHFHLANTPR